VLGIFAFQQRVSAADLLVDSVPTPLPLVLPPCLQNPSDGGITVCIYAQGAAHVDVLWRPAGKGEMTTVATRGVAIPDTPWSIWRVRLGPLAPKSQYRYKIHCDLPGPKAFDSPSYAFTTLPLAGEPVKFAVFNDVHNHLKTLDALMQHVKPDDYDFSLLLGDMWTDPSKRDGADNVFRTLEGYIQKMNASEKPMVYVRGNHETRNNFARNLGYLFDLPNLDPTREQADQQWNFNLRTGPVWIVALDTGEDDRFDTPDTNYRKPKMWQQVRKREAGWLKEITSGKEFAGAPWRIIASHIPLYNNNRWISQSSRQEWDRLLRSSAIDLELAAHDHGWKYLPKDKTYSYNDKDDAGVVTSVTETPPWPVLIGGGPGIDEASVGLITVDATTLSARLIAAKDGSKLTEFTLSKSR
jgi:hypothetical protein